MTALIVGLLLVVAMIAGLIEADDQVWRMSVRMLMAALLVFGLFLALAGVFVLGARSVRANCARILATATTPSDTLLVVRLKPECLP